MSDPYVSNGNGFHIARHRRDGMFGSFDPNAFNSQIGANYNPDAFGGSMSSTSGTSGDKNELFECPKIYNIIL